MEKRRVRKGIVKKSIKAIWIIIFILLILIIGAFLFSEKVHKIDMIDNIKNRLLGQVEDVININDNIVDREMNENIVYEDGISGEQLGIIVRLEHLELKMTITHQENLKS